MEIIVNKFKKVADFCYELFEIAELPIHFSKFSNKLYSVYQKLFLLVYKQFRKFTYEELLTDLADNFSLKAYLGLNKLPIVRNKIKNTYKLVLIKKAHSYQVAIEYPYNNQSINSCI